MSKVSPTGALRLVHDAGYELTSEVGREIQQSWVKRQNFLSNTASDWFPLIDGAVGVIRAECKNEGWDGQGSMPVSDITIALAQKVIGALFESLPKGTPAPDAIPEYDGEICVSWTLDKAQEFSLSIGAHGKINYAGRFGGKGDVHGWQPINSSDGQAIEEFIADIVRYVNRLYEPSPIRSTA